jgi:hypothetical protein
MSVMKVEKEIALPYILYERVRIRVMDRSRDTQDGIVPSRIRADRQKDGIPLAVYDIYLSE